MRRQGQAREVLWVFLAALAVRLAFVAFSATPLHWPDPNSEVAWIARNLAADRGFSSPLGPGSAPTAWVAPVVPALWSLLFRAFGELTAVSLLGVFAINAVASAVAAAGYWWLFKYLSGTTGPARRLQVLCFLPVLVWPFELRMVTTAWYYCVQEAALALVLIGVLRWRDSGLALPWTVALAVAVAFLGYVNPSPLLVLAGIVPAALLMAPRERRVRAIGLFAVLVGALLLPWTARNYAVFGKFVPMRSSLGVELQQGNCEEGSVRQHAQSRHPALRQDERLLYDKLGEAQYAAHALSGAARYMVEHPMETMARTFCRVYVFWCSDITGRWGWQGERRWWEGPMAQRIAGAFKIAAGNAPWLLAVAVLALGHARGLRDRWLVGWIAVLYPLPYYVAHVSPEYAYPVHPYLLLFSLSAVALEIDRRTGQEWSVPRCESGE